MSGLIMFKKTVAAVRLFIDDVHLHAIDFLFNTHWSIPMIFDGIIAMNTI